MAELLETIVDLLAINDTAPGSHRRRWIILGVAPIVLIIAVWLFLRWT